MTVDDLLGEWTNMTVRRSDIQQRTKKTYEDTAHRLRRWAKGQDVEGIDLHAYVQAGRADGRAERTLLFDLRLIRSVVPWDIRTNRLPESTRLQIPNLRIDPNLFVINHATPTPDEAGRVLAAMDHDDWRLAATLPARTGARSVRASADWWDPASTNGRPRLGRLRSRVVDPKRRASAFQRTALCLRMG